MDNWVHKLSTILESHTFENRHDKPIVVLSKDNLNTNGKLFSIIDYNDENIKTILANNFHAYELLYRDLPRKFYVDIDMKPDCPLFDKYSIDQMIQNVIEILDNIFKDVFPEKKDLLSNPCIFVSDLDSQNLKKSAHIIFPHFILKNLDQTLHIKIILKTYLEYHKIELPYQNFIHHKIIDLNVYGNNQNFRLPFQSKKGKNNVLIPYQKVHAKDCLVGLYAKHPTHFEPSLDSKELFNICKTLGQELYNKKFPKNAKFRNDNNRENIIDYSNEIHVDLLDYDPGNTSLSQKDQNDQNHNDFVSFMVSCIPNHGNGQSWNVWWSVGQALKNIGSDEHNKDKYLHLWINWSSQCKSQYPNYSSNCISQWNKNHVRHPHEPRFRLGFIICLAHWYFPLEVDSFIKNKEVESFFTLDDNDKNIFDKVDIYDTRYCKPFNTQKYDIIVSQAPMGSGKTYQMMNVLEQQYKHKRVLVLSPRQTFSKEKYADFKQICPDFVHYQETFDMNINDWTDFDKFVVQIESLARFPDYQSLDNCYKLSYDLVILDEIESILYQFSSSTHSNISKTFHTFYHIITKSKKLLLADAFITKRSVEFCEFLKNQNKTIKCKLDINTFNPNNSITAKFLGIAKNTTELKSYKHTFTQHLIDQLTRNKKICVCIASKSFKNEIIDEILARNILYKFQILNYDGDTSDLEVHKLQDVNEIWKSSSIKLVIYTTKITVGINFDVPNIFNCIYIYGSIQCPNIRDILQAHFRVRHIKDKIVYITLNCLKFDNWLTHNDVVPLSTYQYVNNIYSRHNFSEQKNIKNLYNAITSQNILEENIGTRCYLELFIHLIKKIGYNIDLDFLPIQQNEDNNENNNEDNNEQNHDEKSNTLFPPNYIFKYNEYKILDIDAISKKKLRSRATEKDKIIHECAFFYKVFIHRRLDNQELDKIMNELENNQNDQNGHSLLEKATQLELSVGNMWETELFNLYRLNNEIKRYMQNVILELRKEQNGLVGQNTPLRNFKAQENEKRLYHIRNICSILNFENSRDTHTVFGENAIIGFKNYYNKEIKDLFKIRQKRREEDCILSYISILRQIFKYWNGLHLITNVKRLQSNTVHRKEYTCSLTNNISSKNNHILKIYLQIVKNDIALTGELL